MKSYEKFMAIRARIGQMQGDVAKFKADLEAKEKEIKSFAESLMADEVQGGKKPADVRAALLKKEKERDDLIRDIEITEKTIETVKTTGLTRELAQEAAGEVREKYMGSYAETARALYQILKKAEPIERKLETIQDAVQKEINALGYPYWGSLPFLHRIVIEKPGTGFDSAPIKFFMKCCAEAKIGLD